MKQTIPFTSEILFKTMIGELTDISVEHDIKFMDINQLEGNFNIAGSYKMTEASQIEENFTHTIPVSILMEDKYDCSNATLAISDFYYEIINEEILKVHIDLVIDKLEEKEVIVMEEKVEILDVPEVIELKEEVLSKEESRDTMEIGSVFNNLGEGEETYSTYYVYIVRENDTIDTVIDKYNVTKEELMNYNNLEEFKLGSKIVVPTMVK